MHILKIQIDVPLLKQIEFEHAVSQMLSSPSQPNKMKCEISKEMRRPNTFIYTEEWEADELMQHHFNHEDFRTLIGAMKTLGTISDARIISSDSVQDFSLNDE